MSPTSCGRLTVLRNGVTAALLLVVVVAVFVGIGALGGTVGAIIGLVVGVVVSAASYLVAETIALRVARAVEVAPGQHPVLHVLVRRLSERAGLPPPRIHVSPDPQPNAFVSGGSRRQAVIVLSMGLLSLLRPDELEAVVAHEVAHLSSGDVLPETIASTIAWPLTALTTATLWRTQPTRTRGRRVAAALLLPLGVAALLLAALVLRIGRSPRRELRADRCAVELLGDPEPLARALGKLGATAGRVPMAIDAAHATAYVVDPLHRMRGDLPLGRLLDHHPPIAERTARLRDDGRPSAGPSRG